MIGVHDCYGESGSEEALFQKHGLTSEAIAATVRNIVAQNR